MLLLRIGCSECFITTVETADTNYDMGTCFTVVRAQY